MCLYGDFWDTATNANDATALLPLHDFENGGAAIHSQNSPWTYTFVDKQLLDGAVLSDYGMDGDNLDIWIGNGLTTEQVATDRKK